MRLTKTQTASAALLAREVTLAHTELEPVSNDPSTEEMLRAAAAKYKEYDDAEKAAKKLKDKIKPALLLLMTQAAREDNPPTSKEVTAGYADVAYFGGEQAWVNHYYPGHILESLRPADDGEYYHFSIIEDPALFKYEFEADGHRFGRTVAFEGADFKVDAFYDALEDTPDDWRDDLEACVTVSYEPQLTFNEEKAQDIMARRPETVSLFRRYTFPGEPKTRMLPVRKGEG